MDLSRRSLILATAPALLLGRPALAAATDAVMAPRILGSPSAKLLVQEWFSLTCTHCARFSQQVFPEVKAKLIDTGRIRYMYGDFPLDQIALAAAVVARALPPERYEPFVQALLAAQDRWAFSQANDPMTELAKMAALAGMSHATFQATIDDKALKQAILDEQNTAQTRYKIDSTPSFVFGTKLFTGEMDYDTFLKQTHDAGA